MLRLIHKQTVSGPHLVDDIDDGLPNKQAHRTGNPQVYSRDGYALAAKQPCYIPRTWKADATVAGFADLEETERVTLSAFSGKIKKLQQAGFVQVVSLVASDLTTPAISAGARNTPGAGELTITGTNFLSVTPVLTKVRLFGAGVGDVTLNQTVIVSVAPGAISQTSIIIDNTLIPGLAAGDKVIVTSDGKVSNTWTLA